MGLNLWFHGCLNLDIGEIGVTPTEFSNPKPCKEIIQTPTTLQPCVVSTPYHSDQLYFYAEVQPIRDYGHSLRPDRVHPINIGPQPGRTGCTPLTLDRAPAGPWSGQWWRVLLFSPVYQLFQDAFKQFLPFINVPKDNFPRAGRRNVFNIKV